MIVLMGVYQLVSSRGGLSDYEDKGTVGSFKFGSNLNIRKRKDTISAGQALVEEGVTLQSTSPSTSPSASRSPSSSPSPSPSLSKSPSASASPSAKSPSASFSPSASRSPSASVSASASTSPSASNSPSTSPSGGLDSVFSDLIMFFVKCTDGNTYGAGSAGKIYRRNPDSFWVQVYDAKAPIRGFAEKPSYGGKIYLEWATRTELHRKEIPGNLNWNDVDAPGTVQGDEFPKTNLSDYPWHTMVQVGGSVMIANGPMLAMSAYDDSYTNEALDLIPGNLVKTLVERNGNAVIGAYRAADPLKGVNGMVDAEIPLMQVGDDGDIYYADFSNSIAVKRLPGGGKVNPGGMTNEISQVNIFSWEQSALSWIDKQSIGNMALMGVFGADTGRGGIYSFGRRRKDQPFVMNLEYQYDADEIGAVCNINGTTIFSYRNGSTYGVMAVDPNNKATGIYEGLDFKAPVKRSLELTEWKTAELFMDPLPLGAAVEFWYRCDKVGDWVQATLADSSAVQYTYEGGKKAVFKIGAQGEIFEPRVKLIPVNNLSPEVHRTRVYFT